jgi:hypothetical protein
MEEVQDSQLQTQVGRCPGHVETCNDEQLDKLCSDAPLAGYLSLVDDWCAVDVLGRRLQ